MKKRLPYLGWFGVSAVLCIMFAGMGFSDMRFQFKWLLIAAVCAVVAVCALIGILFPDKMERLFFGKQGEVKPGENHGSHSKE